MNSAANTNPAPKTYRRGDFAAVPAMGDTYQVVNTRTGKRSQPRRLPGSGTRSRAHAGAARGGR